MSFTQLHIPTRIQFGSGCFNQLQLPDRQLLLITGEQLREPATELAKKHPQSQLLIRPVGEPSSAIVDQLAAQADPATELVLAIGGGSTLDAAKGVALLLASGGRIAEYEFGARKIETALPLWALPTTCGSGSEVTPYAVINNSTSGRKFTLGHPYLQPQRAIVDPQLLKNLDQRTFAAGCLDAFIHAFEARHSLQHNLLVDPFAETAMQLIWQQLPSGGALPQKDAAWEALARASLYGGLSIAHSRTGLIHTLSVALAKYTSDPHGLLNARVMPYVLSFNQSAYAGGLAGLLNRISGRTVADDQQGVNILSDWLRDVISGEFRLNLQAAENIPALADRVEQDKGLPGVNPRPIGREELEALLKEIVDDAT